jgi:hypothetical protein
MKSGELVEKGFHFYRSLPRRKTLRFLGGRYSSFSVSGWGWSQILLPSF